MMMKDLLLHGNINEIKLKVNEAIERSNLQDVYIDNIQEMLANMLTFKIFQDLYPSKEELNSFMMLTQRDIGEVRNLISKGVKTELNEFIDQTKQNFLDVYQRIKNVNSSNVETKEIIENLPKNFSDIDKKFDEVDESISILENKDVSFKSDLDNIQRDVKGNSSSIRSNYNEFKELKNIVKENQNKIKEILKTNVTYNSKDLNQLFLDNTNILYYLDQCSERFYLQDCRQDQLERMIRGIETPDKWHDWNRLFSLLNLLKLKISRLSLVRHTQMKDIIFDESELISFKHLLNEIELKLKNFPDDELEEIDIDRSEIQSIIDNIDAERSIDPGAFEFYPNYPEIDDESSN